MGTVLLVESLVDYCMHRLIILGRFVCCLIFSVGFSSIVPVGVKGKGKPVNTQNRHTGV